MLIEGNRGVKEVILQGAWSMIEENRVWGPRETFRDSTSTGMGMKVNG